MEKYLKKSAEETPDLDKKRDLEKLSKIYNQLIEVENSDLSQLTNEKYIEIKNKIADIL